MQLSTLIENLPKTAPRTIQRLRTIGIKTYGDLIQYYPFRYNDFSIISSIERIQPGETVTVRGVVETIQTISTRKRITIQKAILRDESGVIELIWYNQPYLIQILSKNTYVSASGLIESFTKTKIMKPMEYEVLDSLHSDTKHTGRIVPIYPSIYGLSTKTIREKIYYLLDIMNKNSHESLEYIPSEILNKYSLMDLEQAITTIHKPTKLKHIDFAKRRLGFDELFIRILSSRLIKKRWSQEQITSPININNTTNIEIKNFIKNLPFVLTVSQDRVIKEILRDLQKKHSMNRFLQGDVGSGKTVVAAIAAYAVYLNGKQTLIMAPTEILAQQHFATITALTQNYKLKVALQTGSHKDIVSTKSASAYDIIIGTHALNSAKYDYRDVALVIVDEQHRFGVKQRALLKEKGINPHLLSMTATPIPRTVSLTLYSELDLSIINELPKGRKIIKTYVIPPEKRNDGYRWIAKQIKEQEIQTYIICPLIDSSENESMSTVKAAKDEFEQLKKNIFPTFKIALLHGKMKTKEKEKIMKQFNNHQFDILVSTSVVEVGVDIPNATIMLIEGAERYGLAQLHQLRGRVGRAQKQSYCLLYTSTNSGNISRLKFFAKTHSGFKLSEFDLKIRGPGEIYGTRQHGYSDLKIADLTDTKLVLEAKEAVNQFFSKFSLMETPKLKKIINSYQLNLIENN